MDYKDGRLSNLIYSEFSSHHWCDLFFPSLSLLLHLLLIAIIGLFGNGGGGGFSDSEAMQLKDALIDLSDRIRAAANRI